MGMIVVVDVNGQRVESAITLLRLLDVTPVKKIILAGAPGSLFAWNERLQRSERELGLIEVLKPQGRKDEATVLLTARAIELAMSEPDCKNAQWLVISRRDGFQTLCELLQIRGVSQAKWVAALNQDVVRSIVGGEDGVSGAIRDVAAAMITKNHNQPVLIGALANSLMELIPEISKAEDRERLFGTKKFKNICVAVGLKIKGDHILPGAMLDEPAPECQ